MSRLLKLIVCLWLLGVNARTILDSSERYDELLTIRPLRDGKVFANFEFRMTASSRTVNSGIYTPYTLITHNVKDQLSPDILREATFV
jgi:hypothetical protein